MMIQLDSDNVLKLITILDPDWNRTWIFGSVCFTLAFNVFCRYMSTHKNN